MGSEFDPTQYIRDAAKAKQGIERGERIKQGSGVLCVSLLFFKKPRKGAPLFIAEHVQISAENPPEPAFEVTKDHKLTDRPLVQRKNGEKISIIEDLQSEYGPAKMGKYFRKLFNLSMEGSDQLVAELMMQLTDRAPGKYNDGGKIVQPARGMLIGYDAKTSQPEEGEHKGKTFVNAFLRSIGKEEGNDDAAVAERRAKYGGDSPIPVQKPDAD